MNALRRFSWLLCIGAFLVACHSGNGVRDGEADIDLPDIREKGELVVLTLNSSVSYFDYQGEPMGFQYELAKQFAASLGLQMRIKTVRNAQAMVDSLLVGSGGLIAYNLPVTNAWKDSLLYCGEENITHQVLVQREGREVLKDVTQLIGKDVYVIPGKHKERLENLNEELGGGIQIHTLSPDSVSEEELISWVSTKQIDYTVATNDVARLNRTYFPNLNITLAVSFDQRASWAVRKTSPLLAEAADKWHREHIGSPEFVVSAKRYFEQSKRVSTGEFLSVKDGKISYFDPLFRKYAETIGWDWRLLASLAYAESNFHPEVVSWAGARGLMQLMPSTARAMGVPQGMDHDPEESIKGAVKYIARLQQIFSKVPEKDEREKFVLAAYNAGVGHVTDAMALAEKYGRNRYRWEHNVDHFILLKSNETYFLDPVCKHGYFRGTETYNFVRDIIARAEIYKKKIKR